jgi:2-methylcitrate dehydratase PrpD
MAHVLGLAATRAAGLKSQFGTMGKPYNAGVAAANGVESASLARFGVNSADDGLSGPQGFVETHTPKAEKLEPLDHFLFEENKYKLHACCHGTHAMIEALRAASAERPLALSSVKGLVLRINPRWLRVCDIKVPRSGLVVKFSFSWLAGMVLRGDRTGDRRIYTDALANDETLSAFARSVEVIGDETVADLQASGSLRLEGGDEVLIHCDLARPMPVKLLADRLRLKAEAMLGDDGTALWDMADSLETLSARAIGARLAHDSFELARTSS